MTFNQAQIIFLIREKKIRFSVFFIIFLLVLIEFIHFSIYLEKVSEQYKNIFNTLFTISLTIISTILIAALYVDITINQSSKNEKLSYFKLLFEEITENDYRLAIFPSKILIVVDVWRDPILMNINDYNRWIQPKYPRVDRQPGYYWRYLTRLAFDAMINRGFHTIIKGFPPSNTGEKYFTDFGNYFWHCEDFCLQIQRYEEIGSNVANILKFFKQNPNAQINVKNVCSSDDKIFISAPKTEFECQTTITKIKNMMEEIHLKKYSIIQNTIAHLNISNFNDFYNQLVKSENEIKISIESEKISINEIVLLILVIFLLMIIFAYMILILNIFWYYSS